MRVLFRPEARDEALQARDWYERHAPGLGSEFNRALEVAVAAAQRSLDAYPLIAESFRRVLLRRFPYSLVYEVYGDSLIVLACFHQRRNPRELDDRLRR